MLKITINERSGCTTFALEGRLCGQWATEASRAWSQLISMDHTKEIVLDLEGVTFIDRDGEALLAWALERGTKVRASGVLVSHMVQEVRQKAARSR
jgi:anti-anti-sigma regulatory factor